MKKKNPTHWEVGNVINVSSCKNLLITSKIEVAKGRFLYALHKKDDPSKTYRYSFAGGLIRVYL